MPGSFNFLLFAICIIFTACNSEPHYIHLDKSFSVHVEVLGLRYKAGEDSAASAKPSFRYFDVDVVHTKDTSYTIWQEKIRISTDADSALNEMEANMQTPTFTKGAKAVYSLHQDGSLGELLNWPEIKTFVDSVSLQYIVPFVSDEEGKKTMLKLIESYNIQPNIENKMFKCISLFHTPYGLYLDTMDIGRQRIFDVDMIIHPVKEQLAWYQIIDDRLYFLTVYPEVSTDIGQTFLDPFLSAGLSDSLHDYLSQMHFTDTIYCEFNLDKNRLNSAQFNRTLQAKENTFVEIIELKVFSKGLGSD